jgi:transcriptional regulator with XRE-family HTH domain
MTTGERIAALRQERGWSQAELAAALAALSGRGTITREEVSRWERGRRVPTPYWLSNLAAVFGVPAVMLRPPGRDALPVATADVLGEALDWLVTEPPQMTARRSGRRVGRDLAADIARRAARLRHLDDTLPGHELAPVAAAEFKATAALVANAAYSEETGRSLLTSLGETGQILGWIEADMGRNQTAQYYYLEGFHAARQASDIAGAANILSCIAYMWVNAGAPRDGRGLAAAAVHRAEGRIPPLAGALLRERLGYASAYEGDAAATARALGPVDDMIEVGSSARENEPEWTYWLDHGEARVLAARCATRLGNAGAAVPLIHAALAQYSSENVRELALYWSFLAEAYLRAGQLAEASDALQAAAGYATGTSSARVGRRVAALRQALRNARNGPRGDGRAGQSAAAARATPPGAATTQPSARPVQVPH